MKPVWLGAECLWVLLSAVLSVWILLWMVSARWSHASVLVHSACGLCPDHLSFSKHHSTSVAGLGCWSRSTNVGFQSFIASFYAATCTFVVTFEWMGNRRAIQGST